MRGCVTQGENKLKHDATHHCTVTLNLQTIIYPKREVRTGSREGDLHQRRRGLSGGSILNILELFGPRVEGRAALPPGGGAERGRPPRVWGFEGICPSRAVSKAMPTEASADEPPGLERKSSLDIGSVVGGLEEWGHAGRLDGGAGRVRRVTQDARKARRACTAPYAKGGGEGDAGRGEKPRPTAAGISSVMADKFVRPAERRRLLEEEKKRVEGLPQGAYSRHRLKVIESALDLVKEIQQLEFDVQQSVSREARRGQRRAKESMLDKDLHNLLSQLSL